MGLDLAVYPYQEPGAPRTLVDILRASVLAHPDALAIDNGRQHLSYTELARCVTAQSQQLRGAGVRVGDRVGVRVSSGSIELYVGILGILGAGAAYVPVDVDDPDDRAELVWTEANVCAVLTDHGTLTTRESKVVPAPEVDQEQLGPESDAWIIFTSGSTGKPKGVAVSHRSASAFIDAESQLFLPKGQGLAPGDRVLAGLSVAFDASCEEMWLAWRHGACLVPAPRRLVKAGADLGMFLLEQRISVVSTVPTLAALWPTEALRMLRLLILGGEACSSELASRLAQTVKGPVWNTYGPTEATVVSCAARLTAGETVRIGLPLVGWKLAVVGPDGCPVRWGEVGELLIGGVGTARYLDQDKDRAKFTPCAAFNGERAYRSGDLVRAEPAGLLFVGRDDEQIKLGGRRIELGEIDAALMKLPGVSAAASAVRRSEVGSQVLVGYIVRGHKDKGQGFSHIADRALLRRLLPATLVPMLIVLDDLPVRTSGKVDRKALPWPPPSSAEERDEFGLRVETTLTWLADQWRAVLGTKPSSGSNFFDLGGTSLAAAQLVSQVRKKHPSISVADVYEHPILEAMAAQIDHLSSGDDGEDSESLFTQNRIRQLIQLLVQLTVLFALFTYDCLRWLTTIALSKKFFSLRLAATTWAWQNALPWWLIAVAWVVFITLPGRLLITVLFVRLLTFRVRPGKYRRGGSLHLRLWAAERLVMQSRIAAIAGTPWCWGYAWLLGCEVGTDAHLHSLPPVTGLASFGAGCAIEPEADVAGWWLDGRTLHIGTITIGEGARVGARSTLLPGTVLQPGANVQAGKLVQGTIMGPDILENPGNAKTQLSSPTLWTHFRYAVSLLLLDFMPIILLAPIWGLTPTVVHDYGDFQQLCLGMLMMTPPGAVLGLLLYSVLIIGLVRLAGLAIRPGLYSWHGTTAWAVWLTHFLLMDSRTVLFAIYASLLTPTWLRLLGARIGRYVESSTVVPLPSLLSVQDGAFLADNVLLSPFELGNGRLRLGTSAIGEKAFVGNSAMVGPNIEVASDALIGVLGITPDSKQMMPGSSWLGSPPISLPRRVDLSVDECLTFKPPLRLILGRALIESCRLLPLICSSMLMTMLSLSLLYMLNSFGIGWAVLAGGGLLSAAGLAACSITTVAKWLITPVISPGKKHPLWSSFVWRNELADTFIQSLAVPWFVRTAYGTPLLSWWMSTLGAKIGRGVWLDSHHLPEAELVQLDDGVTVNRGCVLQTHLFHDRLMRLGKVHLQHGATLGPYAITLPGTTIGSDTTIGPNSLVMRGEHIPASTRWKGNPIRRWAYEEKSLSSGDSSGWDSSSPA